MNAPAQIDTRESDPSFTLDAHIAEARKTRSPATQAIYDAEQAEWVAHLQRKHDARVARILGRGR